MPIADVDGKSGQIVAGDLPLVVLLCEDCPDEPLVMKWVRQRCQDAPSPRTFWVSASSHR